MRAPLGIRPIAVSTAVRAAALSRSEGTICRMVALASVRGSLCIEAWVVGKTGGSAVA
jgi:hypothetical protein